MVVSDSDTSVFLSLLRMKRDDSARACELTTSKVYVSNNAPSAPRQKESTNMLPFPNHHLCCLRLFWLRGSATVSQKCASPIIHACYYGLSLAAPSDTLLKRVPSVMMMQKRTSDSSTFGSNTFVSFRGHHRVGCGVWTEQKQKRIRSSGTCFAKA